MAGIQTRAAAGCSEQVISQNHCSLIPHSPVTAAAVVSCYRASAWKQHYTLNFGLSVKHDVAWWQYWEIFQRHESLNYVRVHLSLTCQRVHTGWGVTSGDAFVDVNLSCEWPLHKNNEEWRFHIWVSLKEADFILTLRSTWTLKGNSEWLTATEGLPITNLVKWICKTDIKHKTLSDYFHYW